MVGCLVCSSPSSDSRFDFVTLLLRQSTRHYSSILSYFSCISRTTDCRDLRWPRPIVMMKLKTQRKFGDWFGALRALSPWCSFLNFEARVLVLLYASRPPVVSFRKRKRIESFDSEGRNAGQLDAQHQLYRGKSLPLDSPTLWPPQPFWAFQFWGKARLALLCGPTAALDGPAAIALYRSL